MKLLNITLVSALLVISFYVLAIGKAFFVPIIISIVIWYLVKTIATEYARLKIFGKNTPWAVAMFFSFITMGLVIWFLIMIIDSNINKLIQEAPFYQVKLQNIILGFCEKFNIPEVPQLREVLSSIDFTSTLSSLASTISSIAGLTAMITVYLILILLESHTFENKLRALLPNKTSYNRVQKTIENVNQDIKTYVKIKTFVSFLTAMLSYIVLLIVGVDFAPFWGLLIFFLNYIPTIGSIVAVLFPVTLSLVQFDTIYPFIILLVFLTAIQIGVGSILDPRLMGKSLNLSPLVIILSLALWGKIWGILGMFLCVPIMVIINIILAKFNSTRPIAIILSAKGKVK